MRKKLIIPSGQLWLTWIGLIFFNHFLTFPVVGWVSGWVGVGQIKINDHLSPAETETGAELGKTPSPKLDLSPSLGLSTLEFVNSLTSLKIQYL